MIKQKEVTLTSKNLEALSLEEALQMLCELLAQESAKLGIWDWTIETGALYFSPELNSLYGLPPNTIKTYQDWI